MTRVRSPHRSVLSGSCKLWSERPVLAHRVKDFPTAEATSNWNPSPLLTPHLTLHTSPHTRQQPSTAAPCHACRVPVALLYADPSYPQSPSLQRLLGRRASKCLGETLGAPTSPGLVVF